MGLLELAKRILPSRRKSWGVVGIPDVRWERIGFGLNKDKVEDPYRQNAWVQSAVRKKAQNIASVPLKFFTGVRGTDQKQELPLDHPWRVLFDRPSPLCRNTHALIFRTSAFLDLYGEAPHLALGPDGQWIPGTMPAEIYIIHPKCLREEVDPQTQMLRRWQVTGQGLAPQFIPPEQLGMLLLMHPTNPWRGLSPLEAAQLGLDYDYSAHNYNVALMRNGADPGGIVKTEGVADWTAEQHRANRLIWEERYRGSDNAGRVAFMDTAADYIQINADNKKLQFMEARQWSREEVMAVLDVTPWEMGMVQDFSYASAQAARRALWEIALIPRAKAIEDFYWQFLFLPQAQATGQDIWVEFDLESVEALRHSFTERLGAISQLAPYYGINDINERLDLGMPQVAWGGEPTASALPPVPDELMIEPTGTGVITPVGAEESATIVPLGAVPTPDASATAEAAAADATAVQDTALNGAQIQAIVDIVAQVAAGTLPAEAAIGLILVSFPTITEADARRIVLSAATAQVEAPATGSAIIQPETTIQPVGLSLGKWRRRKGVRVDERTERIMLTAARRYFAGYRDLALRHLRGRKALPDDAHLIDRVSLTDLEIEDLVVNAFDGPSRAAVRSALRALKGELGGFSVIDPLDPMWLEKVAPRIAQLVRVGKRDRMLLARKIQQWVKDEGVNSVRGLADQIEGHFKIQSQARALTIARTETGMIQSQTRYAAMKDEGVEKHEWIAANDAHTRQSHRDVDGEIVEVGALFSNGLRFPLEPGAPAAEVISCRCRSFPL